MDQDAIIEKLERVDQRTQANERRISNLEDMQKTVNKLAVSVNSLANNMHQMLDEQKAQGERLQKLEAQPGERWNNMQRTVFNTVLGAISSALAIGIMQLIASNM